MSVDVRIIDYKALRRSYVRWRLNNSAILNWYQNWVEHWRQHA